MNPGCTFCYLIKNQFYFGRNREKCETGVWEFQHDILCLLKKYQNKYNIIFKDYPNGYKSLWKKILRDINADKISYISNEYTVNDLLRVSDLNIMPWASTTFFEALYFDADIFVIEEDIFEKPFKPQHRATQASLLSNAQLPTRPELGDSSMFRCKVYF